MKTIDPGTKKTLAHFQSFLSLNEATFFNRRIYYPHSLKKLARVARRCSSGTQDRIGKMVKSRTGGPILRCALPRKMQRRLGILPAL